MDAEKNAGEAQGETMSWTFAIDEAAMKDGSMASVFPRGLNILMVREGGEVFALEGKCAHMACPLASGSLDGYILTCPCHDWKFDIRTGQFLDAAELGIAVYPVKSDNGKLYVDIG